jgi:hypothetical protein
MAFIFTPELTSNGCITIVGLRCQDSSVGHQTMGWVGRGIGVRFQTQTRDFCVLHSIQNTTEAPGTLPPAVKRPGL